MHSHLQKFQSNKAKPSSSCLYSQLLDISYFESFHKHFPYHHVLLLIPFRVLKVPLPCSTPGFFLQSFQPPHFYTFAPVQNIQAPSVPCQELIMSFELINECCPAAHRDILKCACKMMHEMEKNDDWMLTGERWRILADEVVKELSRKTGMPYNVVIVEKEAPLLKVYSRERPVIKEELLALPSPIPAGSNEQSELQRTDAQQQQPVHHQNHKVTPSQRQQPAQHPNNLLAHHPHQPYQEPIHCSHHQPGHLPLQQGVHRQHHQPAHLSHCHPNNLPHPIRKRSATDWEEQSMPPSKRHRSWGDEPHESPPQPMHPHRDPRPPPMRGEDPKYKVKQEDLSDRIFPPREEKPRRYHNQRRNHKPYPNHRARSNSQNDPFPGSTGRYQDQYTWDARDSGGWEDRDRDTFGRDPLTETRATKATLTNSILQITTVRSAERVHWEANVDKGRTGRAVLTEIDMTGIRATISIAIRMVKGDEDINFRSRCSTLRCTFFMLKSCDCVHVD